MANITFKNGEEYLIRLGRLSDQSEEIIKKAIYPAADLVANKIRENLQAEINDPSSAAVSKKSLYKKKGQKSTGDLLDSLGITPIRKDGKGYWNAKIGFDGYDRKGVPNQLKARAIERGTSKMRERPFVKPAVASTGKQAQELMRQVVDEETKKIMERTK